jgi:hypothetical protein
MSDVDETPNQEPEPTVEGTTGDAELDQLESDFESVDAALRALDADEIDEAEALTVALADETPAEG